MAHSGHSDGIRSLIPPIGIRSSRRFWGDWNAPCRRRPSNPMVRSWGPGALGTLNRPCFFFDLGDVIGANHPLQPCADDGSGCQSSSPGFFRQYGKETTDLKGRQWDTIHGQAEISNNTPQFVASRQFYKFIHEMISQFVNAHQILNAHLQFSR